jgi:hypothetical protein
MRKLEKEIAQITVSHGCSLYGALQISVMPYIYSLSNP